MAYDLTAEQVVSSYSRDRKRKAFESFENLPFFTSSILCLCRPMYMTIYAGPVLLLCIRGIVVYKVKNPLRINPFKMTSHFEPQAKNFFVIFHYEFVLI